ncbi:MAG: DUF4405 domain-containing protein [Candidatus Marinimicrobia bacterium]|nr:DUF4405 domain-containing protein [Candidatus Neomarinimicrobiota bacterium]
MKKSTFIFWTDVILIALFSTVIFSGYLLHRFPAELKSMSVMGLSRYEWANLHWLLSLLFLLFILAHLLAHTKWMKVNFKKYLKMGPIALIASLVLLLVAIGFVAPTWLTNDFPHRREFKSLYQSSPDSTQIRISGKVFNINGKSIVTQK